MTKRYIYFLIFVFALASCSNQELSEKIVGEWTMHQVFDGEKNVTDEHNPKNNRWITFNEDGTFKSGGDPFGDNTGKWTMNNEASILFIDSDADDDDSEWNVSFNEDKTIWTGIGDPRKEGFKLVHKRK